MPFGIGPLELVVVLLIVLVIFGPKRLPGLGKQLGTGMREFKDSVSGKDDDDEKAGAAALPAAESDATVTAAASADAEPAPAQEPSKPPA